MFKIRYSYGEVGNDRLADNEWERRFPYLYTFDAMKYVDKNNNVTDLGWDYGDINNSYWFQGYHYSQIASPNLGWEIAKSII